MEGVNEIFGGAGDDLILAGDGTRVDGGAGDDEIFSAFPNADDAHDDGAFSWSVVTKESDAGDRI